MAYYFKNPAFDLENFSQQNRPKYGLPQEIKFCTKCVMSNQRPSSVVEYKHTQGSQKTTINFNDNDVCDACIMAEKKGCNIDWAEREQQLVELCNRHRSKDGFYDCLVPGSGGKDSFFASHLLKTKYGMNPLTVTWAPHIYTPWGWHNLQSWIKAGFDNYLCSPNGRVHRLLTRIALEQIFHPFQPFIIGQKSFAPKMAALFNIPLIFYGESGAEYGNPIKSAEYAKKDPAYFSLNSDEEVYLGGVPVSELKNLFCLSDNDLQIYMPTNPEIVEKKQIEFHYLGYYVKWHPQECYYYACEHSDFQPSPERTAGTYSKYNSIDDKIDDLHYYTTFIKFGFGRATHEASQEIRCKDITRDEGISLVKRFDGEFPERFINEIFDYLSINEKEFPVASKLFETPIMNRDYFESLANKFRSPHIWEYNEGWRLKKKIF